MSRVTRSTSLLAAGALAATLAGAAQAQGPAPAATPGVAAEGRLATPPTSRDERSGFGGEISGRVNLIGPGAAGAAPEAALPLFAPQRLDKLDGPMFPDLKLPRLVPPPAVRPPQPAEPGAATPQTQAALPPAPLQTPPAKQPLTLAATFDEHAERIPGGVKWRVFTDQPDASGEHLLVAESSDASPKFELDPGAYIVHAVYGLVGAAKYVTVKPSQPASETLVLKAGGVRLGALVGAVRPPDGDVSFTLSRDEGGVTRTVAEHVKPGQLLRLPAGAYHVVSNYGDANAVVEVDLQIGPGKLVDAQVHHRAAPVSLRLVETAGGAELRNTSWTILTPGGDVIRDSIGALPKIVLAEGDYTAIARRDGRMYQKSFTVRPGGEEAVEVIAR